ncbi:MAG: signal recognition particle-docking protein FtsY [Ignavibacteria bacterium GWA2_54_16]|nr:MAG: signal recognition particle-docking protein FtsY [Ignavibacteria bacterium GWA2_54_16]
MAGMFDKLASGLAKTRESIFGSVRRLVNVKSTIDDELLKALEDALLVADVGTATTERLIGDIRRTVKEKKYESVEELGTLLRDEVAKLLAEHAIGAGGRAAEPHSPFVVLVVGVNGAGKTTTIGKLAYQYREAGKKVLIGAADTFRAAANEQLEVWAERAGVKLIQQAPGADPASVAFDALSSAIAQKADVVMIDTAGRLHTKASLMEELRKIRRVIGKCVEGAPHEVLLVLDANTGQNGLQQVRQFSEAAGVTGIVLTKLDGTAKGGIILAISHELRTPVKYIGIGEGIDDLQPFDRQAFVEALFRGSGIPELERSKRP